VRDVITPPDFSQGASLLAKASAIWWRDSFSFLPNLTPLALALCLPSAVLALINSRSNSAKPPNKSGLRQLCETYKICTLSKLPFQPPALYDHPGLGDKLFPVGCKVDLSPGDKFTAGEVIDLKTLSLEPALRGPQGAQPCEDDS
jgi:hypothetical protein